MTPIHSPFLPVVSSEEMARIEKEAIQKGSSEEAFVQEAGKQVALEAIRFIEWNDLPKKVFLLVGKGNKGADAYAAGIALLDEGFQVRALPQFAVEECSAINQKMGEAFRKKRGKVGAVGELDFRDAGLILDGLLGTGFKGQVAGALKLAIQAANGSGLPVISIDLPSGLNGTTGATGEGECAIRAMETVMLGLPKWGCFIGDGWDHCGEAVFADFGLPKNLSKKAKALAFLCEAKCLRLPPIVRTRHKYQAGYVVGFGGSKALPGAVKLTGLASLRSGAGIVRVFCKEEIGPAPFELICNKWNERAWKQELKRATAVFVGPGLGDAKQWMKRHSKSIQVPAVFDADALLHGVTYPELSILTPHRGEALRLLGLEKAPAEELFFAKLNKYCDQKNVAVVLKGAPTFVFLPRQAPIIVPYGDPGMATAGSGDVLTGVLAALLAQGMQPFEAAVTGAALHGIAGEIAAEEKTSYSLIASDLIDALPRAFQTIASVSE